MIKLSEHKTALSNLGITIEAIERLDKLIEHYDNNLPGPAYVIFDHLPFSDGSVHISRPIMVAALQQQREQLVEYLATLGIDAS